MLTHISDQPHRLSQELSEPLWQRPRLQRSNSSQRHMLQQGRIAEQVYASFLLWNTAMVGG